MVLWLLVNQPPAQMAMLKNIAKMQYRGLIFFLFIVTFTLITLPVVIVLHQVRITNIVFSVMIEVKIFEKPILICKSKNPKTKKDTRTNPNYDIVRLKVFNETSES